jgi:hypothetical protein
MQITEAPIGGGALSASEECILRHFNLYNASRPTFDGLVSRMSNTQDVCWISQPATVIMETISIVGNGMAATIRNGNSTKSDTPTQTQWPGSSRINVCENLNF